VEVTPWSGWSSAVCGLDVHKKTVVACVRVPGRTGAREQHVRTFGTTTAELLALRDWLTGYGVTHVAMGGAPRELGRPLSGQQRERE
jgi:hypothetical protein